MWGVVIGVVLLIVVGGALFAFTREGVTTHAEIAGVKCQSKERLDYHKHAQLRIFIEGQEVPVAANVGRLDDKCLFWLHTHGENGLIHIEAPEEQPFTLGQFFEIWEQPLSETRLLDQTADGEHEVQATLNGEQVSGDPADILLEDGQTIILQYGPPFADLEAESDGA